MQRRSSSMLVVPFALLALPATTHAQSVGGVQFVNAITVDAATLDRSDGTTFDRRLGMFSDLYYDASRNEWWGLSDRGPGGGTLPYDTRVQRFTLNVDHATGQVSAFQVQQTIKFMNGGSPLSGLAPSPSDVLGNAFDPEGIVVDPKSGHLFVSDEYGPSLVEFDRTGNLVRRFTTPANIVPRNATTGVPNFASDAGNTAGKTTNRGFEGLAVSPDGKYLYASLQSGMLDEIPANGNGSYARIVKFDVATGQAVGQYAYRFSATGQGRGVSALVALGNEKFLILERNNRGVGVGATLATADKNVFEIDLAGATDVTHIDLDAPGASFATVQKSAQIIDLDATTLAELNHISPEKWEGLAIGPRLANGRYLILTGTDNDYSVTQNASGAQFDVWFDFSAADPYAASIQCPIGTTTNCVKTSNGKSATWTSSYRMLPGVLQAYTADVAGYVAPMATTTPEPATITLLLAGLGATGLVMRRRRA